MTVRKRISSLTLLARISWLGLLYLVQGLPFGFQANALSALLRERGFPLHTITLSTALALPWSLKAIWAPFVDRFHWPRLGRRKSWIVPMQIALIACAMGAALALQRAQVIPLLLLIFAMNFCAATMDIAVDGLAVDILAGRTLGVGNAAQVVGYKIGMMMGGGLLVWLAETMGWGSSGVFSGMAGIIGIALFFTLLVHEEKERGQGQNSHTSLRSIWIALLDLMKLPAQRRLLLLVATYKAGESLIAPLLQPLLIDQGFSRSEIAYAIGTIGMAGSISGSLLSGLWALRVEIEKILSLLSWLRIGVLGLPWLIVAAGPFPIGLVAAASALEHFVAGSVTTAMFAWMMQHTDRRIGASHYTLLATVEVLGKSPLSMVAGSLASWAGPGTCFGLAMALSTGWALLFRTLLQAPEEARCQEKNFLEQDKAPAP
ncbi:MAG: MFS transporter [Sandaracinaceae bacterium]|nr:MFS transporter [Sandaracinaceae bacterium]